MTWHLDNIPQLRSHSHSPSGQRAPLYQVRVPQSRKSLIHAALSATRHWPPCESSNRSNALALDWICARTQICTQCGTQLETAVRTSPQSLWSRTIWGIGKSNVSLAQSKFRIAGPAPSYEHTNALLLCVAVLCCCACALFAPTWGPLESFRRQPGTYRRRRKACAHHRLPDSPNFRSPRRHCGTAAMSAYHALRLETKARLGIAQCAPRPARCCGSSRVIAPADALFTSPLPQDLPHLTDRRLQARKPCS